MPSKQPVVGSNPTGGVSKNQAEIADFGQVLGLLTAEPGHNPPMASGDPPDFASAEVVGPDAGGDESEQPGASVLAPATDRNHRFR